MVDLPLLSDSDDGHDIDYKISIMEYKKPKMMGSWFMVVFMVVN